MSSSLEPSLALRKDLLFVVAEFQNHSSHEQARIGPLTTDLNHCLAQLELDIASSAISTSPSRTPDDAIKRRCEAALRTIFLRYTRANDSLSETDFLLLLRNFRVIPVLINEKEASQAFRAKTKNNADVKQFLEVMSICSLAFARPPHNAKIGTTEIQLWRFLGLTDGSWRKRLSL